MNAPLSPHDLTWLLPRLLGVVYLLAFTSLAVQIPGLYGSRGILPVRSHLEALHRRAGDRAWRLAPSLFWFGSSDRTLLGSAILGAALSLLLSAGGPALPLLVFLWLLYLSFASVGQEFLSYQWDALLLETGFMTIFLPLADPAPPLAVIGYCCFLFRFMFSAGVVKLNSGDPTWRTLTALCYHYETQPLPNRVGWYAHQLPVSLQKLSVVATFVMEIGVPFLALGPAPARLAGFFLLTFFQILIFATGSYGFFNILAMVLLVPLLAEIRAPLLPIDPAGQAVSAVFLLFLLLNFCQLLRLFHRPAWLRGLLGPFSPCMISNPYGLFAVMTTNRFEFVIEGSNDGEGWHPYEFRWKPGDPARPPRQAAPHQPRLDWQMWFAALDPRTMEPWLGNLLVRLLEGSAPVLALLGHNPFPDAPPHRIRLSVYRYEFATLAQRRTSGLWWQRTLVGRYAPMALRDR
jgi:hypothetical protein